ncbi:MAG: ABC transporter substrate-binding protein [Nannocystaceae bacterium]
MTKGAASADAAAAWSRRRWLTAAGLAPLWACEGAGRTSASTTGTRVVSQTVLSDEVLWDLGPSVRSQVVAVSTMADDPRYSRVVGRWPASIARAAGTSEALLALAPDLVILASFTAVETQQLIRKAGLTALVLERFDGFADYRDNVRAIATAVDAAAAADEVIERFDARLSSLRVQDPAGPKILSWNEGSVPGASTSFHDIATAAGYRNLPAEHGRSGHLQLGVEQLVAWDPEVLVVPCGEDDCERVAAQLADRPGLRSTRAVREGHVVTIPSRDLYSTGAGMLDVVERLVSARPGIRP